MLECVVNISEGRSAATVADLAASAGDDLLDVHTDADHNRSVLTLVGDAAPRRLTRAAVATLDLRRHRGAHPRIGVVDVVPFVPLAEATLDDALAARDSFGRWAAEEPGLPGFAYGPERTLPDVRRHAFASLRPTWGPPEPHPRAGAVAVGARLLLVAYNLWLAPSADLATARAVAATLRSPQVRALGLAVGDAVQVSMNLIAPDVVGPAEVWDAVAAQTTIARAELVGLVPESVLTATPERRWESLDLAPDRTVEDAIRRRRRR